MIGQKIYCVGNYVWDRNNFYVQDPLKIENIIVHEEDIIFDTGDEQFSMSDLNITWFLDKKRAEIEKLRRQEIKRLEVLRL